MAAYVSLATSIACALTAYGLWVAERRPRWRVLLTVVAVASLVTSLVSREMSTSTG